MKNFNKNNKRAPIRKKKAVIYEADDNPFKIVLLREELFALTQDATDAILLGQLIYWQARTGDADDYIAEEVNWVIGDGKKPLEYGWIYKSSKTLSEEVFLGIAEDAIRIRLKKMVKRGWLNERKNPIYRYDQKRQYRVNLLKIDGELRNLKNTDGTNAGFYLVCGVLEHLLPCIPNQKGMDAEAKQVGQPAPDRIDVESIEIKNRIPKPETLQSGSSKPSTSKNVGVSTVDQEYAKFLKLCPHDAAITYEDFETYKEKALATKRDGYEGIEIDGDELQSALAQHGNWLDDNAGKALKLVNEQKEKWLVDRKQYYYMAFSKYDEVNAENIGELVSNAVKRKFWDRKGDQWVEQIFKKSTKSG